MFDFGIRYISAGPPATWLIIVMNEIPRINKLMFPLISAPSTFAVIISTAKLIRAEIPRVINVLAILLNTYLICFLLCKLKV